MSRRAHAINVLEAFRDTVHAHHAGVAELAASIGMVPGTLYNKANVNDDRHPPTLSDAVLVMNHTGNKAIAEAFAHVGGGVFVPVVTTAADQDQALFEITARWMCEQGKFFEQFHQAVADGRIDAREHAQLQRTARSVVQQCMTLLAQIERIQGGGHG